MNDDIPQVKTLEGLSPFYYDRIGRNFFVVSKDIACFVCVVILFFLISKYQGKQLFQFSSPNNTFCFGRFEMNENKELLFSNAVRSWIVDYILRRKAFKKDEGKAFSFGML